MKPPRTVLTCTCRGTIPLDPHALAKACAAPEPAAFELCRADIARLHSTPGPLLITCTQEAPTFREAHPDAHVVNIRETAGWSDDAPNARPKIAALVAEAQILAAQPQPPTLTLRSSGITLIIGTDDRALEAAERLKDRLDLTVMLTTPGPMPLPLRTSDYPVVQGTIRTAKGHLGAFELTIDNYARAIPSSRAALAFETPRNGATSRCDLILDLTGGPPLFRAKREGYLRPDPADPLAIERALFAATDLVGDFDKPRYATITPALCAHARNGQIGCTRCLDACPIGAITPAGDTATIDPHICAGCGTCAAVCPTAAAAWLPQPAATTATRLRAILTTYHAHGATRPPILLVHDHAHGAPLIDALARAGSGLPAYVIPFAEPRILGLDLLATALAYGAAEIRTLIGRTHDREALIREATLLDALLIPLGHGESRAATIQTDDPFDLAELLAAIRPRPAPTPARFLPLGNKREITRQALAALHATAPTPQDPIPLPKGAPLGRIHVAPGCTLCLACVSVCPTSALRDGTDRPALRFIEDNCVQCGLCQTTCPENVITLEPRATFASSRRDAITLREEPPALCRVCAKPFGTKSSIDRVAAQLTGQHWMFKDPAVIDRIYMCADCRMRSQARQSLDPYAGPPRPPTRTADDYR